MHSREQPEFPSPPGDEVIRTAVIILSGWLHAFHDKQSIESDVTRDYSVPLVTTRMSSKVEEVR